MGHFGHRDLRKFQPQASGFNHKGKKIKAKGGKNFDQEKGAGLPGIPRSKHLYATAYIYCFFVNRVSDEQ